LLFHNNLDRVGAVRGKIDLHGTRNNPIGFLQLRADDLLLKNGSGWLPPEPLALDLALTVTKNNITLEKAAIFSKRVSLQLQGVAVNQDFFGKGVLTGDNDAFAATGIDLQGSLACRSIDWLAGRHEILRRTAGQINADFKVSGSLAKPQFKAAISVQDGEMRFSGDLPALQDASLQAQLADSVLEISQFTGTLGGALFKSAGKITLPDDDKVVFLDLNFSGKDLLFYRAEGITFRGDAVLMVHGRSDRPQVDGDIILTDARVTRNIDFVSSLLSGFSGREAPAPRFPAFTAPPLRDALFNLTITAQEPVLLANNMLRGKVTPHLELHGTGEVPFLSGKLYITEANVALPAGKVQMNSGLVQFLETDPDRPVLELNGTAKMLGYDIVIGISGPYDAPIIMLSSTPSASNEEILLLLLAGQRPVGDRNQPNQLNNYSNVVVYMAENLLKSLWPNGDSESDTTILDRLQLEIGKNITQQGEETIEAKFILAENIRNGQNALLLTGEKDVWDKYNGGLRLVFKFK
jgi:translocation and assembly module TamB